jgi:hypothetical protein
MSSLSSTSWSKSASVYTLAWCKLCVRGSGEGEKEVGSVRREREAGREF